MTADRAGVSWTAATADETETFGARLMRRLPDLSRAPFVIELRGALGSGKTTFARGALRALGVQGSIKSPSYTLLEVYPALVLTALHLDLYRLTDPAELEQLALRDYYLAGHVWFIEWPERAAGYLPKPDLLLQFTALAEWHHICANSGTPAGTVTLDTD